MALTKIDTVEELYEYLYVAIQLEHATIPPYLTALYSIPPDKNREAYDVIRVVVVEEMLHLTLSANILNAVGGTPNLNRKDFVPEYPTALPNGETDFEVSLEKFSKECIETFLNIERPAKHDQKKHLKRPDIKVKRILPTYLSKEANAAEEEELHFYSIGEFYAEIERGLTSLSAQLGEEKLFCGNAKKQVTPEYYYSGGGDIVPVYDLESAKEAIRLISEQGEGFEEGIYDQEGELSHYYRFQQIQCERYYIKGDTPESGPQGGPIYTNWDAVYPIKTNARNDDYPSDSELFAANVDFNRFYKKFLAEINEALNGKPEKLIPAVGKMFIIKNKMYEIMRNEIPEEEGVNGAPTFDMEY